MATAALRHAEQGEPVETHGVDHQLEIVHRRFEAEEVDVPVREPQLLPSQRTSWRCWAKPSSQWRHTGLSQS